MLLVKNLVQHPFNFKFSSLNLFFKPKTIRLYTSSIDYLNSISTIDCNYMERKDYANAYLIHENKFAAFIDNNTNHSVPILMKELKSKNLEPENVQYIIITHVHLDHAGGTSMLSELCPKATILAHEVCHELF